MPALTEGCWFWVNEAVPEKDRSMSVLCDQCRTENYPKIGSYYNFSNGVGAWDITCGECDKLLWKHTAKEEDEELLAELDKTFDKYLGGTDEKN